ncbi:MAG: putative DNA binding domain-containing protein [Deltaproteobacteria bacterium]|nr:putative DNA binding domain-containing protein [Deltaproteobacteria bacterium]MCW5801546.1 putative DNA binding domain-containing protein [Deltaproteobacteria bacterium]
MAITEAKLRQLIGEDEGQYFDRKSLLEGPAGRKRPRDRRQVRDQIAEYVAGFANADGGIVIFGVEDDHAVTGHSYPGDVVDQMLAVPQARLVPPQPSGYRMVLDGTEVLVFEVESAVRAVRVDGGGFPYRIGDATRQFSEEYINAIKDEGLVMSAEARRASVQLDALDPALLARAVEAAGGGDTSPADYLVRRRLADWFGPDQLILRQAAVFLFAARPETIDHPNAGIRVMKVAGTERQHGQRYNVREFPRVEGNLSTVLAQAGTLIDTLIERSVRLRDMGFEETPEYPEFAWKEAIVNAVAHRDYRMQGQATEVWIFDDRIEVLSPGGVVPEVSLDDLKVGRPAHVTRNPRIARVLADLGSMRDLGEGIPRMFENMEDSFLPLPEIDVVQGRFRVVLRKTPIFSVDDPRWLQSVRALPISVAQKRALVAFADRDLANSDYVALSAVDRDTAYRELTELAKRGLVSVEGEGAGTRYRVVRAAVPVTSTASTPIDVLSARLKAAGFITNADVREAFEVDRFAATTRLNRWVRDGALVREGERKGARYRAGDRWPPSTDL